MIEIHLPGNPRWESAHKISIFKSLYLSRRLVDFAKFGTEVGHVTADTLQTFKVNESKVKVTAKRKG